MNDPTAMGATPPAQPTPAPLPADQAPPAPDPAAAPAAPVDAPVSPDAEPVVGLLDDLETRLDEVERVIADLLVSLVSDVPLERDEIHLSMSGDSSRPDAITSASVANPAPVTAAVDMTATGGFDADGVWHDVLGRFAKRGWSGLKWAALHALDDHAAARAHVEQHGETKLRVKDRDLARRLGAPDGMVLARFGDAGHAIVNDGRGRPVRVPWDSFDRDQPMVRDRTLAERVLPNGGGHAPRMLTSPGMFHGEHAPSGNDRPDDAPTSRSFADRAVVALDHLANRFDIYVDSSVKDQRRLDQSMWDALPAFRPETPAEAELADAARAFDAPPAIDDPWTPERDRLAAAIRAVAAERRAPVGNDRPEMPWHADRPAQVSPSVGDRVSAVNGEAGGVVTGVFVGRGDERFGSRAKLRLDDGTVRDLRSDAEFYASEADAADVAHRGVFAYLDREFGSTPSPGGGWHDYQVEMRYRSGTGSDGTALTPANGTGSSNAGLVRARTPEEAVAKAETVGGGWPTGWVRENGDQGAPTLVDATVADSGALIDPATGDRTPRPGPAPTLDQIPARPLKSAAEFPVPAKSDVKFGRKEFGMTDWSSDHDPSTPWGYHGSVMQREAGWVSTTRGGGFTEPQKSRFDAAVEAMRLDWQERNPDPAATIAAEQAKIDAERAATLAARTEAWQTSVDAYNATADRLGAPHWYDPDAVDELRAWWKAANDRPAPTAPAANDRPDLTVSPEALARQIIPGNLAAPADFEDTKARLAAWRTRDLMAAYDKLDVPDPSAKVDDAHNVVGQEAARRGIEFAYGDNGIEAYRWNDDPNVDMGDPLTPADLDALDPTPPVGNDRPDWHTDQPATPEGAATLIGERYLLRNSRYAGRYDIIEATPAPGKDGANGWYDIKARTAHSPENGAPVQWATRLIDAYPTEEAARTEARRRRNPRRTPEQIAATRQPLYGDLAWIARLNGVTTDGTGRSRTKMGDPAPALTNTAPTTGTPATIDPFDGWSNADIQDEIDTARRYITEAETQGDPFGIIPSQQRQIDRLTQALNTRNTTSPTPNDRTHTDDYRPTLSRRIQSLSDPALRDLTLAANGGIAGPFADDIATGTPIIDVSYAIDGDEIRLTRTPGVATPEGGFLAAGEPERASFPLAGVAPEQWAEGLGRTLAGPGTGVRVRRAGDVEGTVVAPAGNDRPDGPTGAVLGLNEEGVFDTVDRVTPDMVEWAEGPDPDFPGDTHAVAVITGQFAKDRATAHAFNEVRVNIHAYSEGWVTWDVDGANPEYDTVDVWQDAYRAKIDPFAWSDPLEAPSWYASGEAPSVEEAKAAALAAVNDLDATKVFRPVATMHREGLTAELRQTRDRAWRGETRAQHAPGGSLTIADPGGEDLGYRPIAPAGNDRPDLTLGGRWSTAGRSSRRDFTDDGLHGIIDRDSSGRYIGYLIDDREGEAVPEVFGTSESTVRRKVNEAAVNYLRTRPKPDAAPFPAASRWSAAFGNDRPEFAKDGGEWAGRARSEGWTVTTRDRVVTIEKRFTPGDADAYVQADNDAYWLIGEVPRRAESSVWGTTSDGVGGHAGMRGGYYRLNVSGVRPEFAGKVTAPGGNDSPGEARRLLAQAGEIRRSWTEQGTGPWRAMDGMTVIEMLPIDMGDGSTSYGFEANGEVLPETFPTFDEARRWLADAFEAAARTEIGAPGGNDRPDDSQFGNVIDAVTAAPTPDVTVLNPPTPDVRPVPAPNRVEQGRTPQATTPMRERRWEYPTDGGFFMFKHLPVRPDALPSAPEAEVDADPAARPGWQGAYDTVVQGFTPADSTIQRLAPNPNVLEITSYGLDENDRPITNATRPRYIVGTVTIDGDNAALHSGDVIIPVPRNIRGDAAEVSRWAATVIGNADHARYRVKAARRPDDVWGRVFTASTPHGVVLIRGTMAQPFFEAKSIQDALDRSDGPYRGAWGRTPQEKYQGRNAFSRRPLTADGRVDTKVVVLTEDTARRWKAAYDGVLADMDEAKARAADKRAARAAARAARQQTLVPSANDLVDMDPAARANRPGGSWLVAGDNYLSRLGIRQGQAAAVRYVNADHGEVDVLSPDGEVRPTPVKWERFSPTAPAAAPKVDLPEQSGNPGVASKADSATLTANRVKAAGPTGAPVEVADSYLSRYGISKGQVIHVAYHNDRSAVFNAPDGRQVKAGWARFTGRTPVPDGDGWRISETPETPDAPAANDRLDDVAGTIVQQMGNMNLLAVSGGRRQPIPGPDGASIGVRLPVAAGYRVDIVLDQASDTYTVTRVFSRSGRDFPKGSMSGVHAENVGDIAYAASNYLDPFGVPDGNDSGLQLDLLALSPNEVTAITNATPTFTTAGWRATDAVGGFRSPSGIVVRRRPGKVAGAWEAVDFRSGPFSERAATIEAGSAESVIEWAKQRDEWMKPTPVDTSKLVSDAQLAEIAADPSLAIYPSMSLYPSTVNGKDRNGIVVAPANLARQSVVLGRWNTPQEAAGAYDDLRRRFTALANSDHGRTLIADAVPLTFAQAAELRADHVDRGDWIVNVQGHDLDRPVRVISTVREDDGTVRLVLDRDDGPLTVPAAAAVEIRRPTPGADTAAPQRTLSADPDALEAMSADQRAAVRHAAEATAASAPDGSPVKAQAVSLVDAIDAVDNGGRPRSMQGHDVTATAVALDEFGVPPKTGTAPIPADAVRVYVWTPTDPTLSSTLADGTAPGSTGVLWAQTYPPKSDAVTYVEMWVRPDEIAAGHVDDRSHVAIDHPLAPSRIVSFSTPAISTLQRLRERFSHADDAEFLMDIAKDYPVGSPERVAYEARAAELGGAAPVENGFRPFDLIRSHHAASTPNAQVLAALAASGVPGLDGAPVDPDTVTAMAPSALRQLDHAMSRWLAAHPYGDYSGADPFDVSVAPDAPASNDFAPVDAIRQARARRRAETAATRSRILALIAGGARRHDGTAPTPEQIAKMGAMDLGVLASQLGAAPVSGDFLPMSPLDAPGDFPVAAALDPVDDVEIADFDSSVIIAALAPDPVEDIPIAPRDTGVGESPDPSTGDRS